MAIASPKPPAAPPPASTTTAPRSSNSARARTVTSQNVFNIDYVNDLLLRDDNSTSGSLGITGSGLGQRLFVQHDANFNDTALTNASGVVQDGMSTARTAR